MTPKEKAQDLVNKMLQFTDWHEGDAQECALIAVDEMIEMLKELERVEFLKPNSAIPIIEEVKKEIEEL
jgi:hypothetical protein